MKTRRQSQTACSERGLLTGFNKAKFKHMEIKEKENDPNERSEM
jgi:hypothetical protein